MGGIGGKGKGARRRQKLKDNAKVFDKKTGSFREAKIELIDGQVTREELLKAPSSFRRFMEATRRAREQQDRRDKRDRIARGEEDEGEDDDGDGAARNDKRDKHKNDKPNKSHNDSDDGESDSDDEKTHTWLHPDKGDHGAGVADDVAFEEAAHKKKVRKKKEPEPAAGERVEEEDGDARTGKRKHKSLRERKSEARKAAKAAKEEEDQFMGTVVETRDAGRAGDASFGQVADAPPTITLKRKSGGKGAKSVPVSESGHKIAGSKGAGNRQAQIFANLMAGAGKKSGAKTGKNQAGELPMVGLRRAAEMQALREQAISEYRKMKNRPAHNGRSSSLGSDPTKLFRSVGDADLGRD